MHSKNVSKAMSVLLSATMVAGMVPFTAMADVITQPVSGGGSSSAATGTTVTEVEPNDSDLQAMSISIGDKISGRVSRDENRVEDQDCFIVWLDGGTSYDLYFTNNGESLRDISVRDLGYTTILDTFDICELSYSDYIWMNFGGEESSYTETEYLNYLSYNQANEKVTINVPHSDRYLITVKCAYASVDLPDAEAVDGYNYTLQLKDHEHSLYFDCADICMGCYKHVKAAPHTYASPDSSLCSVCYTYRLCSHINETASALLARGGFVDKSFEIDGYTYTVMMSYLDDSEQIEFRCSVADFYENYICDYKLLYSVHNDDFSDSYISFNTYDGQFPMGRYRRWFLL